MTIDQALTVKEGSTVVSPHTQPKFLPLRVSKTWINEKHTIARFRIHKLQDVWLDSTGVEFPKPGTRWSKLLARWVEGDS